MDISDSAGTSSTSSSFGVAIAAAAVGLTLVVAGVVLYRRREQDDFMDEKPFDKHGDMTVAGDTYAGDTYDGTASIVPPKSSLTKDEEDGLVNVDLSSQRNHQSEEFDPAWGEYVSSNNPYKESQGSADSEESESLLSREGSADEDGSFDSETDTRPPTSKSVEQFDARLGSLGDDELEQELQEDQSATSSEPQEAPSKRPLTVEEIENLLHTF